MRAMRRKRAGGVWMGLPAARVVSDLSARGAQGGGRTGRPGSSGTLEAPIFDAFRGPLIERVLPGLPFEVTDWGSGKRATRIPP